MPSTSEYKLLMCFRRASLTSHIALKWQLGKALKLRTRLGPQYPQPTTPTTIGSFISLLSKFRGSLLLKLTILLPVNALFWVPILSQATALGRFPFRQEKPLCLAASAVFLLFSSRKKMAIKTPTG